MMEPVGPGWKLVELRFRNYGKLSWYILEHKITKPSHPVSKLDPELHISMTCPENTYDIINRWSNENAGYFSPPCLELLTVSSYSEDDSYHLESCRGALFGCKTEADGKNLLYFRIHDFSISASGKVKSLTQEEIQVDNHKFMFLDLNDKVE